MIRHIVWWTLKEQANGRTADENAWHILKSSASLRVIPEMLSLEVSRKIEASSSVPAGIVLTTTHKNMEELDAYRNNPVHLQFAAMLNELVNSRNVIDFEFDPDSSGV